MNQDQSGLLFNNYVVKFDAVKAQKRFNLPLTLTSDTSATYAPDNNLFLCVSSIVINYNLAAAIAVLRFEDGLSGGQYLVLRLPIGSGNIVIPFSPVLRISAGLTVLNTARVWNAADFIQVNYFGWEEEK